MHLPPPLQFPDRNDYSSNNLSPDQQLQNELLGLQRERNKMGSSGHIKRTWIVWCLFICCLMASIGVLIYVLYFTGVISFVAADVPFNFTVPTNNNSHSLLERRVYRTEEPVPPPFSCISNFFIRDDGLHKTGDRVGVLSWESYGARLVSLSKRDAVPEAYRDWKTGYDKALLAASIALKAKHLDHEAYLAALEASTTMGMGSFGMAFNSPVLMVELQWTGSISTLWLTSKVVPEPGSIVVRSAADPSVSHVCEHSSMPVRGHVRADLDKQGRPMAASMTGTLNSITVDCDGAVVGKIFSIEIRGADTNHNMELTRLEIAFSDRNVYLSPDTLRCVELS